MANRAVLSCVDETCRRVMGNDRPFGGKTVILLGDFRQTGPVIRGGSRKEIVDASIKSSPLWSSFTILPSGHTLFRKQFPLAPAYATTFNSCQGLTLDRVGVDLTRPVFSHGQLYTALTRIRTREHALVRLTPGETSARNVTYKELLL